MTAQHTPDTGASPSAAGQSSTLLTHEHHEVDEALLGLLGALDRGEHRPEPVLEAITSLRRHIYLEEALMFPPLAERGLMMPIAVMLREHGRLWRTLDTLTVLITGAVTPEKQDQVRGVCEDLLAQLESHNVKEEQIVYGSAETMLTPEERDRLVTAIETADLPYGWVCQEAFARP